MSSLYQNEVSAETRMRRALELHIRKIQSGDGYKSDVRKVFLKPPTKAEITAFPAVACLFGEEVAENEDQSDQLWHMALPVTLLGFVQTGGDTLLARENLKLDLLTVFGNAWQLPDAEGRETCMIMSFQGASYFGIYLNEPFTGVAMRYTIRYRPTIPDPTVLA